MLAESLGDGLCIPRHDGSHEETVDRPTRCVLEVRTVVEAHEHRHMSRCSSPTLPKDNVISVVGERKQARPLQGSYLRGSSAPSDFPMRAIILGGAVNQIIFFRENFIDL